MITRAEFIDSFSLTSAVFPNYRLEQSQVLAYYELIKDLDVTKNQLTQAIGEVCKVSKYFPTVAEIRLELQKFVKSSIPAHQKFNELEFKNPEAVPMPQHLKDLIYRAFTPEL